MDILACQGDIAREATDALVSPADTQLSMSGGAAAALRQAGGEELAKAAEEQAPIEAGDAVLTSAYELFAEYVIHAAAKPAHEAATEATVRAAIRTALDMAVDHGCASVVSPLIGSGVGGLTADTSLTIILEETKAVDGLEEVRLIARDRRGYRRIADQVDHVQGRSAVD